MRTLRQFAVPNDCSNCDLQQNCVFGNLPDPLMRDLSAIGHITLYPPNATLLTEGQKPRGVYIACSGSAKLSLQARDGKTIILRIAGNQEVMGLSTVISGGPSLITVTTIDLCQIKFVERKACCVLSSGTAAWPWRVPRRWRGGSGPHSMMYTT